jgi:hypothetical protein
LENRDGLFEWEELEMSAMGAEEGRRSPVSADPRATE